MPLHHTLVISTVRVLAPYWPCANVARTGCASVSAFKMHKQTTLWVSNFLISDNQATSKRQATGTQGARTYYVNSTNGLPVQYQDLKGLKKPKICTPNFCLTFFTLTDPYVLNHHLQNAFRKKCGWTFLTLCSPRVQSSTTLIFWVGHLRAPFRSAPFLYLQTAQTHP